MNIELLKWMVEKSDGFEIINPGDDDIILRCPDGVEFYMMDFFEKEPVYYSDLLQKAIEGINRDSEYTIIIYYDIVTVCIDLIYVNPIHVCSFDPQEPETLTIAKLAALTYIWEEGKIPDDSKIAPGRLDMGEERNE